MSIRFAKPAAILACAAALVALAPAHAEDAPISRTVSYADLDVSTAAGADQLKRRVARAAGVVCGNSGRVTLAEQSERLACRADAIASAEPQMQILFAQAARGGRYADARGAISIGAR